MTDMSPTADGPSMLLKLPNEVIYRIIDQVHPHDIENLAVCCRTLMVLAGPAVALHRERRALGTLALSSWRKMDCTTSPLALLRAIYEDWRVAVYPTTVAFKRPIPREDTEEDSDYDDDDEDELFAEVDTMGQAALVHEATKRSTNVDGRVPDWPLRLIAEVPALSQILSSRWKNDADDDDQTVSQILINRLTNLTTLSLSGGLWRDWYNMKIFRIASQMQSVAKVEKAVEGVQLPHTLDKLREVRLIGSLYGTEMLKFRDLAMFAKIASVRSLYAVQLFGGLEGYKVKLKAWNITALEIRASFMNGVQLRSFLRGVQALERFIYHQEAEWEADLPSEVDGIVRALRDYARCSLKHLQLSGEYYAWNKVNYAMFLRDFTNLKSIALSIDLRYYCDEKDNRTVLRILGILPDVTQHLVLIHSESSDLEPEALEWIAPLHNLKEIVFDGWQGPCEAAAGFVERCGSLGIAVTYRRLESLWG